MKKGLSHNKNFILNILGSLVSNIGAVFYSFAVSFYILKITNNNSIIQGTYLAIVGVVSVISMLLGGVIADRFNKVKIMYLCDFLKGGLLVLSTLLMYISSNVSYTLVILFSVGIIGNIISGIFSPASSGLLPLIVDDCDLQQANASFSFVSSIQSIVGIVLAGVLYTLLPIHILFFIVAGCYIASAISELFITYNFVAKEDMITFKKTMVEIKEGFSFIFSIKALSTFIICILFVNFFFTPISSNFFPYFISANVSNTDYLFKNIMQPEMWNSIFEIAFCLGMIVGSIVVGSIKYEKASKTAKIGLSILSVLTMAMAILFFILVDKNRLVNEYIIILCVLDVIVGLVIPFINVPIGTSIQRLTSDDMRGRVNSALSVCSMGLTPLASFIAGLIISGIGLSALLLICSLGFVLTTVYFVLSKNVNEI